MERDEVAEEQATPEFEEVRGDPAADVDLIVEDDPAPPSDESSGTTQGDASRSAT